MITCTSIEIYIWILIFNCFEVNILLQRISIGNISTTTSHINSLFGEEIKCPTQVIMTIICICTLNVQVTDYTKTIKFSILSFFIIIQRNSSYGITINIIQSYFTRLLWSDITIKECSKTIQIIIDFNFSNCIKTAQYSVSIFKF